MEALPQRKQPAPTTAPTCASMSARLPIMPLVLTMTLGAVVERISRDLERELEDPAYGVGTMVDPRGGSYAGEALTRDVIVNAMGGIAAALAATLLGI